LPRKDPPQCGQGTLAASGISIVLLVLQDAVEGVAGALVDNEQCGKMEPEELCVVLSEEPNGN